MHAQRHLRPGRRDRGGRRRRRRSHGAVPRRRPGAARDMTPEEREKLMKQAEEQMKEAEAKRRVGRVPPVLRRLSGRRRRPGPPPASAVDRRQADRGDHLRQGQGEREDRREEVHGHEVGRWLLAAVGSERSVGRPGRASHRREDGGSLVSRSTRIRVVWRRRSPRPRRSGRRAGADRAAARAAVGHGHGPDDGILPKAAVVLEGQDQALASVRRDGPDVGLRRRGVRRPRAGPVHDSGRVPRFPDGARPRRARARRRQPAHDHAAAQEARRGRHRHAATSRARRWTRAARRSAPS